MVIIDNSVLSFAYHIDNGIPIVPYYEGEEDSELPILAYYLSTIYNDKDLREANRKYIKLESFITQEKLYLDDSFNEYSDEEEDSTQHTDNSQQKTPNSLNLTLMKRRSASTTLEFKDVLLEFHKDFSSQDNHLYLV